MFNFSPEVLEKEVRVLEQLCKDRGEEMVVLDQEITTLQNEKTKIAAQAYNLNRQIETCKKSIIIARGVPEAISELRSRIQWTTREILRTDILVSTEKKLRSALVELQKQLKEECNHWFMVGYIGYKGSYEMDYDDRYCGERLCLVCGRKEYSRESCRASYVYLVENPERLVLEGVHEKDCGLEKVNVFLTLEKLVECAFLHSDRHVNLIKRLCALNPSLKT